MKCLQKIAKLVFKVWKLINYWWFDEWSSWIFWILNISFVSRAKFSCGVTLKCHLRWRLYLAAYRSVLMWHASGSHTYCIISSFTSLNCVDSYPVVAARNLKLRMPRESLALLTQLWVKMLGVETPVTCIAFWQSAFSFVTEDFELCNIDFWVNWMWSAANLMSGAWFIWIAHSDADRMFTTDQQVLGSIRSLGTS